MSKGKKKQSGNGSSDSSVEPVRRLRRELSHCCNELKDIKRALVREREHSQSLERILDDAYDRLEEAGLTRPLEFPLSREAIELYEALDTPASFDEIIAAATQKCQVGPLQAGTLLRELIDEGMLKASEEASGEHYVVTRHRSYF